eukprot:TRINITY_DN22570_c0_g1_i1.p1 TRINITY_DN22570_c0_g1~~TRINITY_DN22570_c0_g1_i1.p1  ORF type:complete len:201 (-),score=20.92 TRINITY_DN22570_c0_g1_i1:87-689(-)
MGDMKCDLARGYSGLDESGEVRMCDSDWLVACMVEKARQSPKWPSKPSDLVSLRCLSHLKDDEVNDDEQAYEARMYEILRDACDLKASPELWTQEEFSKLRAKAQTNKFEGTLYRAVSMINHQCADFNIAWHPQDPYRTLRAIRPIQAGQQVFLTYLPRGAPFEFRQVRCRMYGFECGCPLCVQERRQRLSEEAETAQPA